MTESPAKIAYNLLTAEDDGRVCKDIPDSACKEQPHNFLTHVVSLSLTKTADGLIDPKLILSWILATLGTPAIFIGFLVPVREAGSLLPQLFTAGFLRSLPERKWAWAAGSFVQGLCAGGMAVATLSLGGASLGVAIVGLLAVFALARSVCSVSYKDVLGKTVDKSKRGTATGAASSAAASLVIVFALVMASDVFEKMRLVVAGLFCAALFWLVASVLFTRLTEEKGATEGGRNPVVVAKENLSYLFDDKQLQLFILTRGLLIATALAPPFMVAMAAGEVDSGYGELGWLLLASSGAALSSSYVWGRLADRSSRKVLLYSGLAGGIALLLTAAGGTLGMSSTSWFLPLMLFGLMISYQGVRLGRSTHLVDMADVDTRAAYTALSNTIIGVLLALGGAFSVVAQYYGEIVVLVMLAAMSLLAAGTARRLNEEQA